VSFGFCRSVDKKDIISKIVGLVLRQFEMAAYMAILKMEQDHRSPFRTSGFARTFTSLCSTSSAGTTAAGTENDVVPRSKERL
jgi:hypothetical protein